MDDMKYKILDILSRNLGNPISINQLTKEIAELHGGAYYANIYEKIGELTKEHIITLSKSGRSSIISLNFENYLLVDLLAEMELRKKQDFLRGQQEMQMLIMETETYLHNLYPIKSITMINADKNARLNRVEFMIHMKKPDHREMIHDTTIAIYSIIKNLQSSHNIKIDYLLLEDEMLLDALRSNEKNPIRELMYNKIVIFHPQDFWLEIRNATEKGIKITIDKSETNPPKISEQDLVYNLTRFGYTELGPQIKQGSMICIEYIITAILFHNKARRVEAIPIILAKNLERTNYALLLFLSRKYGLEGILLGILRAMQKLLVTVQSLKDPIRILEAMKIGEVKANQRSMREKLRLYNVT